MTIDFSKYPILIRHRKHISAQYYIPLKELQVTPFNYPMPIEKIDWSKCYENGKPPTKLDIGSAFGEFLLRTAKAQPDENILGMEIRHYPIEYILNVAKKETLNNIYAIHYNILNGIPFIEDESLDEIYYFFPDPWFKNRHQKRRAFGEKMLSIIAPKLKQGGLLLLQTDIPEVHEYHKEQIAKFGGFCINELEVNQTWKYQSTGQEDFCRKKVIDFQRLICQKM